MLRKLTIGKFSSLHHSIIPHRSSIMNSQMIINGKAVYPEKTISNYPPVIQALLQKRQILQVEILPKIKQISTYIKTSASSERDDKKQYVSLEIDIMKFLYDKSQLTRSYWYNVFLTKNEYELYSMILNRIVGYGSEIPYKERTSFEISKIKIVKLLKAFYEGLEKSSFERSLWTVYLDEKYNKYYLWKKNRAAKNECHLTRNEVIQSSKISTHLFDMMKYDLDMSKVGNFDYKALRDIRQMIHTQNKGYIHSKLNATGYVYSEEIRVITQNILLSMNTFLNSREFLGEFDLEMDFYVNSSVFSAHLWLICQRLDDFKKSKYAEDLVRSLLQFYKKTAQLAFNQIDAMRRISKFSKIEKLLEEQKSMLHWHFKVYAPTRENHLFKLDALVWSLLFREKTDRYDHRVFKMAYYLDYQYRRLSKLTLEDFKANRLGFSTDIIPPNYINFVLNKNSHLKSHMKDYEDEKFSDYKLKKYLYFYPLPEERNEENYMKTFYLYNKTETVEQSKYERSFREIDERYDQLRDETRDRSMEEELSLIRGSTSSKLYKLMNLSSTYWCNKYLKNNVKIADTEDIVREEREYSNNLKFVRDSQGKNTLRMSERLPRDIKEKIYKYRCNVIEKNTKALKDNYINEETRIFYPEANVISKRGKQKAFIERVFKL